MSVSRPASRLLWFAVVFLVLIGIAAVARRSLVLLWPQRFSGGNSNPAAALDAGFARHAGLTFLHILPGALFLGLAPFQFAQSFRQKHLQFHRWSGPVLLVCGLIIGTSALIMSFKMNIGGPNEAAATTLFAIMFLICLTKAYFYIRSKNVVRHREWMIRAYGVGLGRSHNAADHGHVLCVSPAHSARVFWNRLLAGIYDHVSRGRGVGGLHAQSAGSDSCLAVSNEQ